MGDRAAAHGHTLAHLVAAWLVAALVAALVVDPARPPWYGYVLAILLLVALGTAVFVTYLQVADQFGCHTLEAFSGLRIEGWKSHLRLRVSADEVVVRVIGIDHAPSARNRDDLRAVVPVPHVVETFRVPWDGSAAADEIVPGRRAFGAGLSPTRSSRLRHRARSARAMMPGPHPFTRSDRRYRRCPRDCRPAASSRSCSGCASASSRRWCSASR